MYGLQGMSPYTAHTSDIHPPEERFATVTILLNQDITVQVSPFCASKNAYKNSPYHRVPQVANGTERINASLWLGS